MYAFFIDYKNKTSVTYNFILLSICFASGPVLGVVDLWMTEINKVPTFKVLITVWGVIMKVIKTNKGEMPKYFLSEGKEKQCDPVTWVGALSHEWPGIALCEVSSEPRPKWHMDSVMLRFERIEFQAEGWARKNPLRQNAPTVLDKKIGGHCGWFWWEKRGVENESEEEVRTQI